jgi:hypothetical protein
MLMAALVFLGVTAGNVHAQGVFGSGPARTSYYYTPGPAVTYYAPATSPVLLSTPVVVAPSHTVTYSTTTYAVPTHTVLLAQPTVTYYYQPTIVTRRRAFQRQTTIYILP